MTRKRKAPGRNSSDGSSELEETTEVDETLQVKPGLSLRFVPFFFNLTKANDSCACAQGAAGEGEGKREGGCTWSESGFIQTVLQGAGCGGAECAAVWPAQLLTAGL